MQEAGITISNSDLKRLLACANGDAALLYLALLRHHGSVQPRSLAGELRWDRNRIEAAETALRAMRQTPLQRRRSRQRRPRRTPQQTVRRLPNSVPRRLPWKMPR